MNLEGQVIQVNLDDIIPNRFQPRIAFDEKALNELASSIKEHGIIQPLVLRKLGKKFEIIAGERRYKAATLAGLTTVPAVISNIDDNSSAEVALVENIQRKDLTPIEEARSYKNLLDKGYLTQEQLAKKMGLSQSAISNKLRLLNLDNQVQQALLDGKISERHARALLTLPNKADQVTWLNKIIAERITVRDLDKKLKEFQGESDPTGDIPLVDLTPNIEDVKNNAVDINNNKPKNIANLLVSEDTMTEYSDNLPTNQVNQPTDTPVETLDVQSNPAPAVDNMINPFNLDAQKPAEQTTVQEASPAVDAPKQEEVLDPFANILNTPEANEVPQESNKFFNQLEDVPASLDNLSPFASEGVFNIDNTPAAPEQPVDSNIEIFDVGTPSETKVEEPSSNDVELIDNESTIMNELNPNNKFFQPIKEVAQQQTIEEEKIEDQLINPMDFVDNIEAPSSVPTNPSDDAVNKIKELIDSLKSQGVNVSMDESDLENKHQIIIQIEK